MPTLWVTYAWDDDRSGDVDFVCQQIESTGIEVKIDRTTLGAGRRLWPQIESFITDPAQGGRLGVLRHANQHRP
jgi:hypothetical protein